MAKTKPKLDKDREHRIDMEIVVDAHDEYERAMGWYCYLENQLQFPFDAVCIVTRDTSPLLVKDNVEVLGIADADECSHEMFVMIRWGERYGKGRRINGLAVPLSQLKPLSDADDQTRQGIKDWQYWVKMGLRVLGRRAGRTVPRSSCRPKGAKAVALGCYQDSLDFQGFNGGWPSRPRVRWQACDSAQAHASGTFSMPVLSHRHVTPPQQ